MKQKKKTVVLGASPNPVRFSYKAVKSLMRHEIEVIPVGFKNGDIEGMDIITGMPDIEETHTISLYIGSSRQDDYFDYIFSLNPERVIFNPGTVNPTLMGKLKKEGIEPVSECMLVMLKEGTF